MTVAFIGYVSGLDVGRNALVVLLAVVALVFLSGNYALLFQFAFQKKRGSFVPPVGGVAGLLAMLLVPSLRRCGMFLLPLILDPGTWALVCGLPNLVKGLSDSSRDKRDESADDAEVSK